MLAGQPDFPPLCNRCSRDCQAQGRPAGLEPSSSTQEVRLDDQKCDQHNAHALDEVREEQAQG